MEMEDEKRGAKEIVREAGVIDHGISTALHSEADLADHDETMEEVHADEHETVDFHQLTKPQLVELLKELIKDIDFKKVDRQLREIKVAFDDLHEKEKTNALNRFILDGGTPESFEYKNDELDTAFEGAFKQARDKKNQFFRGQEDQKNDNYRRKLELLERIRTLVDTQDVSSNQFDQFKELQREWKLVGPVPGSHAKSLWANYHALVDRFYDTQSIYFELKELDRKKNLESKLELCARAEKLIQEEKIKIAIKELNELHHEFKHVGPVPREEKEIVWIRFKTASDAIYSRRDEYLKNLQQELSNNLEQKAKLCEEAISFGSFQSDRIKEWNQKTREILDIQKKWETIGGLPRARAKDINKKFWTAFKAFFNAKNAFFKKLDDERDTNLKKKHELIQRAIELRESQDWDKTSNELKNLQQQWKDIGPVPEKLREKVFREFKEACDHFFEQKRGQQGKQEQEQVDNLKAKEAVCEELERLAQEGTGTVELLTELEEKFNTIGFVPRKDISTIRTRYSDAVEKLVNSLSSLSEDEKGRLLLQNQLMDLKNDPMGDRKIYQREQGIRKKISKVENDIAVWRNNLEFFARSKNADGLRDEFNAKIQEASDHLQQLKLQLKLLRTVTLS